MYLYEISSHFQTKSNLHFLQALLVYLYLSGQFTLSIPMRDTLYYLKVNNFKSCPKSEGLNSRPWKKSTIKFPVFPLGLIFAFAPGLNRANRRASSEMTAPKISEEVIRQKYLVCTSERSILRQTTAGISANSVNRLKKPFMRTVIEK